ncbi:MAG TPA: enoyl-CoA hydratase/isomerase family protein [Myxococcaceae bacterium]|nr:enoyl-CoA hydratase/isomerase family protein [Myxococcaceae bacterium]
MPTLNTQVAEGIAQVQLNRPEVRNAINLEMVREMTALLESLAARDDVRALVLSGAGGKAFASGADIAELRERTHREALLAINAGIFQKLEDFPRPTIAAIEGYALGGGLELALACDVRVGTREAKVGLPEATLGIFPGAGGTWRLPRLVGLGRAKELVFTGRILSGEEAYAIGLFERLCEPGEAVRSAVEMAKEMIKNAPLALQVAKTVLNAVAKGLEPSPLERLGQGLLFDSAEKRERMTAFLARRAKKDS